MRELLTHDYERADHTRSFTDSSWEMLSRIKEPVYRELVLEFYSSFSFQADTPGHDAAVLTFRLGNRIFYLSLISFAVRLGIFLQEETEGSFGATLREFLSGCVRRPPAGFDYPAAWRHFSGTQLVPGSSKESSITDPRFRLLHRLIACTTAPRKESQEKVAKKGVWMLSHFLPGAPRLDLPYLIASAMATVATLRGGNPITLGFLVTKLARSFDILTPETVASLTPISYEMPLIDLEHLRRMKVAYSVMVEGVRLSFWGEQPPQQQQQQHQHHQQQPPHDQEMHEPDPDIQTTVFPAPPLPSSEQVFGDRLRRIELDMAAVRETVEREREDAVRERLEALRRSRRSDYLTAQLQHTMDWIQQTQSQIAAGMTPPIVPATYEPLPPLDMYDLDAPPPDYHSWDEWYRRFE